MSISKKEFGVTKDGAQAYLYTICNENGISATVEACAHGEAMSFLMNTDIVLTSPEIVEFLPATDAKIIATTNLMDKAEVTRLLVDAVKEHFPNEIS